MRAATVDLHRAELAALDDTPQGCQSGWDRTKGQPACPALCPDDAGKGGCGSAGGSAEGGCVAIPLYDTAGTDCAGADCSATIVQQLSRIVSSTKFSNGEHSTR